MIVYNRANARFDEDSAVAVARLPQVVGFKDGIGDLDLMSRIVRAVRDEADRRPVPLLQRDADRRGDAAAYRAIGVTLYSSAVFAFAPRVALAFYDALERDDQATLAALERAFYHPLVRLRAKGTGYAVSLVKAGSSWPALRRRGPAAAHRGDAGAPGGARAHPRGRLAAVPRDRSGGSPMSAGDPHHRRDDHPGRVRRPAAAQLGRRARAVRAARDHRGRHRRGPDRPRRDLRRRAAPGRAARAPPGPIVGADVYHTEEIYRRVLGHRDRPETTIASGLIGHSAAVDRVFSPFEVACLDIQGKAAGRPVADLLGGAVRDEVPFTAYLFYKWAGAPRRRPRRLGRGARPRRHRRPGQADDRRATASPRSSSRAASSRPTQEIEAIRALRDAFPDHPLRLDPNAAWTLETSLKVARELDGVLEYLEDPTPGIDGMAEVARQAPMPLATNMCVVAFDHLPPAVSAGRGPGGPLRPPLLGRPAPLAAARRDLRDVRPRPVHALQLPPRHQPGRDGPPGRRHARTSPTPATPTGRGRPRTSWPAQPFTSAAARCASRPARPRRGARPGRPGPAARAVPGLRPAQPGRHRLHAAGRPRLQRKQPRW